MLELLRIRDLALIEDAELEFGPGLNVLTGETGAGKSFVMRAIDFLTGERMDPGLVRPGKEKATVEALFVRPEGELLLRRELSAETGRSRAYINDRLASQEAVLELRPRLILHTSQHGQQKLLQPAHQARILDAFLPDRSLVAERDAALAAVRAVLARRNEVEARTAELSRQREFLEFQRAEIDKVAPLPGEEEGLAAQKHAAQEAARSARLMDEALDILDEENGLSDRLASLERALVPAPEDIQPEREAVTEFRHRMAALRQTLSRRRGEAPDVDLDAIEARLFEISRLKRKLSRSLDEILNLRAEVEENLSFLDACGLDLKRLEKEEAAQAARLGKALAALNAARHAAAESLARAVEEELKHLGFSEHVRVDFAFEASEPYPGLSEERGRLLWIPNPGQPPRPLDKIASGGELSRFLLALTSLRASEKENAEAPTLIFDEVDAGIGGMTLTKVGEKLKALSLRRQMLLITHWPQLARLAKRHFLISKEVLDGQTYTRCLRLTDHEVAGELARMSG